MISKLLCLCLTLYLGVLRGDKLIVMCVCLTLFLRVLRCDN